MRPNPIPDSSGNFVARSAAVRLPLLSLLAASVLVVAGCDEGEVFQAPPGPEGSQVEVEGRVVDGRDLAGHGTPATVRVRRLSDEAVLASAATDAEGRFSLNVPREAGASLARLEAEAGAPFLPVSRAIFLDRGDVVIDLATSSTLVTGKAVGADGSPADVDFWIFREDTPDLFNPYPVAGGRDFIPPIPASGMMFGLDTDPLGNFTIPIRVPDAMFRLVFAVDRNTDRFATQEVKLFVAPGVVNQLPGSVTLAAPGPPPPPGGEGSVSFAGDIVPLFAQHCTACHSVGGPAAFLGMSLEADKAYGNIVNVPSVEVGPDVRVRPGNSATGPGGSYLVEKISLSSPRVGARMPLGVAPLTDDEINLVRRWIDQEALNN